MISHAMKSALLALSLTVLISSLACATSPPSEYRQGAFVPVEAPVFEPSQDAPHTFRPDAPPRVEPGPRPTRVLPETPETRRGPGLWSSDAPRANAEPTVLPEVVGVLLPYPPADTSPVAREPTDVCAAQLRHVIVALDLTASYKNLLERERECVIAQLYKLCTEGMMNTQNLGKNGGDAYDADLYAARKAADVAADRFKTEKCGKRKFSRTEADIFSATASGLISLAGGTPRTP